MMVILSAFSSVANAEGILIYGWDERIVPAVPAAEKDSRYLGYFYKRFNVYFVPIWRYGGKYVLYQGQSYREISDSDLTSFRKQLGDISPDFPFWDKYVDVFVVCLIGAFPLLGISVSIYDRLWRSRRIRVKAEDSDRISDTNER
jgi:hypothetical protein